MKNLVHKYGIALCFLAFGCSSKEDAKPTIAPESGASYTLDGRETKAISTRLRFTPAPAGATGTLNVDRIFIQITAPPANTSNEAVNLAFVKAPGANDNTYVAQSLEVGNTTGAGPAGYYSAPISMTIQKTSSGKWSGTFSGGRVNLSGITTHSITSGIFTELEP